MPLLVLLLQVPLHLVGTQLLLLLDMCWACA
jgi:hypothetical protein